MTYDALCDLKQAIWFKKQAGYIYKYNIKIIHKSYIYIYILYIHYIYIYIYINEDIIYKIEIF